MPKAIWFTNPEDRDSIVHALAHAPVVKRLREILVKRLGELDDKEINPETYRSQDWSHLQAHFNGRKQELSFLLKLLDLGDTE